MIQTIKKVCNKCCSCIDTMKWVGLLILLILIIGIELIYKESLNSAGIVVINFIIVIGIYFFSFCKKKLDTTKKYLVVIKVFDRFLMVVLACMTILVFLNLETILFFKNLEVSLFFLNPEKYITIIHLEKYITIIHLEKYISIINSLAELYLVLSLLSIPFSMIFRRYVTAIHILIICGLIFSLSYAKLWGAIVLYFVFHLMNWLSSKDSLYYLANGNRTKDINEIVEARWAKQKSKALFIFISVNITFVIKEIIPQTFKNTILDKSFFIINIFRRSTLEREGINDKMMISFLMFITIIAIIFIITTFITSKHLGGSLSIIREQKELIKKEDESKE